MVTEMAIDKPRETSDSVKGCIAYLGRYSEAERVAERGNTRGEWHVASHSTLPPASVGSKIRLNLFSL